MAIQRITVDKMDYEVSISSDTVDGGYSAECPTIPGCWAKGNTVSVCIQNITDKIKEISAVKTLHNAKYEKDHNGGQ